MNEKIIDRGIVCFCDILGYKNILTNNSVNECASIIKDSLSLIPEKIIKKIVPDKKSTTTKIIDAMIKDFFAHHFHHVIVSDSILFFFDFDGVAEEDKDLFFVHALYYIVLFQAECFRNGFPLRSCIDIGPFYYYDHIFAGSTIINCYNTQENMNFSGITITETAHDYIISNFSGEEKFTAEYIIENSIKRVVPLKNNHEDKLILLNWIKHVSYNIELRQLLFNKFNMHNKDISKSAMEKIINTEQTIRYFLVGSDSMMLEK